MEQDSIDKLLSAIANVEKKLDEKDRVDQARFDEGSKRFASINAELGSHRTELGSQQEQLKDHEARLRDAEKNIRDQGAILTSLSGSTARAVDKALDAQRTATQSIDEARKIVESAIRIHGVSMAAAMKDAIQPLAEKVDGYEGSVEAKIKATVDESVNAAMKSCEDGIAKAVGESVAKALKEHETKQAESLKKHEAKLDEVVATKVETAMKPVNDKVDTMVENVGTALEPVTKTFKSRPLRIALLVATIAGAGIGGIAFGWTSSDELAKAKASATAAAAPAKSSAPAPADASTDH